MTPPLEPARRRDTPVHRVSVVIPTCNRPALLREALASVRALEGRGLELEILVGDNGLLRETAAICAEFGARHLTTTTKGAAAARNVALRAATGDYVAFLDDDDYWLPGSLAARVLALEAQPSAGFVYGNHYVMEGSQVSLEFAGHHGPAGRVFAELFQRNFIHTSTVLARRALIDQTSGFHPDARGPEDYALWLQLAWHGEAIFLPQPLSVYRKRVGSLTAKPATTKVPELMRVVNEAAERFAVPAEAVRDRLNPLHTWMAREGFRAGRYREGMRWLWPALRTRPAATLAASLRAVARGARREVSA